MKRPSPEAKIEDNVDFLVVSDRVELEGLWRERSEGVLKSM